MEFLGESSYLDDEGDIRPFSDIADTLDDPKIVSDTCGMDQYLEQATAIAMKQGLGQTTETGDVTWPTVKIPEAPPPFSVRYYELLDLFTKLKEVSLSRVAREYNNSKHGVFKLPKEERDLLQAAIIEPLTRPSYSRFEEIYTQLDRRDDLTADEKFELAVQLAKDERVDHPLHGQPW